MFSNNIYIYIHVVLLNIRVITSSIQDDHVSDLESTKQGARVELFHLLKNPVYSTTQSTNISSLFFFITRKARQEA